MPIDLRSRERLLAMVATLMRHATEGAFERRGRNVEKSTMRFAVTFEVPIETLKEAKNFNSYGLFDKDRNQEIPPDTAGAAALSGAIDRGEQQGTVEALAGAVLTRPPGEAVPLVENLTGSSKWKADAEGALAIDIDEFSL